MPLSKLFGLKNLLSRLQSTISRLRISTLTSLVSVACWCIIHATKARRKKVNPQEIEDNYGLKKDMFHRVIKPRLLKTVPPNSTIGHNPDIMMDRAGNIAYQPAKGRGFQDTGLNMMDIIGRGNVK